MIVAVKSDPLRPNVVVSPSTVEPMKPVTTTMPVGGNDATRARNNSRVSPNSGCASPNLSLVRITFDCFLCVNEKKEEEEEEEKKPVTRHVLQTHLPRINPRAAKLLGEKRCAKELTKRRNGVATARRGLAQQKHAFDELADRLHRVVNLRFELRRRSNRHVHRFEFVEHGDVTTRAFQRYTVVETCVLFSCPPRPRNQQRLTPSSTAFKSEFVAPPIADATTIDMQFGSRSVRMISAAALMRCLSPSDVPPNL